MLQSPHFLEEVMFAQCVCRHVIRSIGDALLCVIAGALLCAAAAAQAGNASGAEGVLLNETAHVLAGMHIDRDGPLGTLSDLSAVREHQAAMESVWQSFARRRLAPMQQFAHDELTPYAASSGPIFYPFSGPDALHALALFPQAHAFLLTGLEPVGPMPDLLAFKPAALQDSLSILRRSISTVLSFSFFRTNDMKVTLSSNRLEGVTPILLVFIARHGFDVSSVESVQVAAPTNLTAAVSPDGTAAPVHRPIPGVRSRFGLPGAPADRVLTYLSADISNAGLNAHPGYEPWVASEKPTATMLKSASYLMHRGSFSKVRSIILEQTTMVVQDDSGIPWHKFDESQWSARLYGHYTHPIDLFANRVQKDLKAAYEGAKPGNLPFAYGYNFQDGGNNLQRFTRKAP